MTSIRDVHDYSLYEHLTCRLSQYTESSALL